MLINNKKVSKLPASVANLGFGIIPRKNIDQIIIIPVEKRILIVLSCKATINLKKYSKWTPLTLRSNKQKHNVSNNKTIWINNEKLEVEEFWYMVILQKLFRFLSNNQYQSCYLLYYTKLGKIGRMPDLWLYLTSNKSC